MRQRALHYWARKLQALGFEVMLIAPQYVKPYVKRSKNDVADVVVIYEAATRLVMPSLGEDTKPASDSERSPRSPGLPPCQRRRALIASFGGDMP